MIIRVRRTQSLTLLLAALTVPLAAIMPACAQEAGAPMAVPASMLPSENIASPVGNMLAQVAPPAPPPSRGTDLQPIDLTPVRLPEKGNAFTTLQNLRTGFLYRLPSKMFLNVNCENSLRYESNVFQTKNHHLGDMVYRIIPDVTVGYAPNRTTRLSANYFMFHDLYTDHGSTLSRTVQSVGFRGDKDFYINPTTVFTTSFMARELFITRNPSLTDLLPSATIVHRVGTSGAVYGSVLGQIRWQHMFSDFQEGDQFYSVGAIYRRPKWSVLADTTLIDNFGIAKRRGGVPTNHLIVMTLEANRRLSQTVPVLAFIRAQPIFNIGQDTVNRPGFAGFNLRLFGGIRCEIAKPAIFPVKLRSS